jgi:hypothetical protein
MITTETAGSSNVVPTTVGRRAEALALSEVLLADIELSRLQPIDLARKASRLARLLDDADAMEWLRQEVSGFDRADESTVTAAAFEAARRSGRVFFNADGEERANTKSLGELRTTIDGLLQQITAAVDPDVSLHSANPGQFVMAPGGNGGERSAARNFAGELQATLDYVIGAIHDYVAARYQELRFGAAVESAFEVVRSEIDECLGDLVPAALPKLSAAFENLASQNPENWASAASTCRRLIKAAADALRPAGEPVDGRVMTDAAYINRLVDWIASRSGGSTAADLATADLEHLGRRLDAVQDGGSKGAHAEMDRFEASRLVTGTYLLLGDILRLSGF